MDHSGNKSVTGSNASLVSNQIVGSYDDFLLRMELMFTETQRRISEMFTFRKSDRLKMEVMEDSSNCKDVPDTGLETDNCLLVSGVPYSLGEDLPLCCKMISLALGYKTSNAPDIEAKRLSRSPIPTGSAPLIQLKFVCLRERNGFFNRYLSSMNLSLRHLGYAATTRIYLNEYLVTTTHVIRKTALMLKNRGHLSAVFVRNGAVYVKPVGREKTIPIYCSDQLNIFKYLSL